MTVVPQGGSSEKHCQPSTPGTSSASVSQELQAAGWGFLTI